MLPLLNREQHSIAFPSCRNTLYEINTWVWLSDLSQRYGSYQNFVAWSWSIGDEFFLIVVNLSDCSSQAWLRVPWANMVGTKWQMVDLLSDSLYERDGMR